ncbi:MAG TPA: cytochrome c [Terracidiphilus sp.]|jgi:thiosulfate dehydrogenase|nr:cytochrome c [Terracidiphilus sp.]
MVRIFFGIILGVLLVPLAGLVWLYYGKVPVAVADPPLPDEGQITSIALHARIDREMTAHPPIDPNEQTFIAGAHVYSEKCAVCHGYHGKPAPIGENMFPSAPPLWEKHPSGSVVGVSDDPPGETYWKVANGIRLSGMPDFKTQLTNTEIWQVSVLLANADKPLPPAALNILRGESVATVPASSAPAITGPAASAPNSPVDR